MRIDIMNISIGSMICRKFSNVSSPPVNNGNSAIINRINTKNMLKIIIRYFNFKGDTPVMDFWYES